MIERLRIYRGGGFDPHENLAVEESLLRMAGKGCCILYLWQNRNTVVIGRNQNAWKECRTALLKEDGGHLARRLSGGGAVYHDDGNLNFTFLLPTEEYDLDRQIEVIRLACLELGIPTEKSGRNDLLADGRKFSGNAFYHHEGHSYHHGTLLVNVDMDRLGRYLQPSKAKLAAKGVDSVRSRVVNLGELRRDLTVDMLCDSLKTAFGKAYSLQVDPLKQSELNASEIIELTERNRSWEWNYGQKLPFDFACEERFDWGELRLELAVEYGVVQRAEVYSDAMDWSLAPALKAALTGCRFERAALAQRVRASGAEQAQDVCRLISEQDI